MTEPECRVKIRELADFALVEALVSFAAWIQDRSLDPSLAADEFSAALNEMATDVRTVLDSMRHGDAPIVGYDNIGHLVDARRGKLHRDSKKIPK